MTVRPSPKTRNAPAPQRRSGVRAAYETLADVSRALKNTRFTQELREQAFGTDDGTLAFGNPVKVPDGFEVKATLTGVRGRAQIVYVEIDAAGGIAVEKKSAADRLKARLRDDAGEGGTLPPPKPLKPRNGHRFGAFVSDVRDEGPIDRRDEVTMAQQQADSIRNGPIGGVRPWMRRPV